MTTVTMGARMLLVALGWVVDVSFRAAMAIAVIGSLITSPFLRLLVNLPSTALGTVACSGPGAGRNRRGDRLSLMLDFFKRMTGVAGGNSIHLYNDVYVRRRTCQRAKLG